jgi:hypothetical protein
LEPQLAPVKPPSRRAKSPHLMCGMPVWGLAGFFGCAYLSYLSFQHVRNLEFDWPHDLLFIVTYGVWILLMAGLLSETGCWRERIFFSLVLLNFIFGFGLAAWKNAPPAIVRDMRIASCFLWGVASLVSGVIAYTTPARRTDGGV